jgi:hypothetical protein
MDRRRLILLAALVLAVSAVVASLSAPQRDDSSEDSTRETAPGSIAEPTGPTRELTLDAGRPRTVTVVPGTHVLLRVEVPEAGEVTIPGLGLDRAAEPGTPAAFDILAEKPGRFDVAFRSIGGDRPRRAATLVVEG